MYIGYEANDAFAMKAATVGCSLDDGNDLINTLSDSVTEWGEEYDHPIHFFDLIREHQVAEANLKKTVVYILSMKFVEVAPFFIFIIFGVPLPISALLILIFEFGPNLRNLDFVANTHDDRLLSPKTRDDTSKEEGQKINMYNDSMRVEHAELSWSRKHVTLFGFRLMSFSFCTMGLLQLIACMCTYLYIMNSYGITPMATIGLVTEEGYYPAKTDIYCLGEVKEEPMCDFYQPNVNAPWYATKFYVYTCAAYDTYVVDAGPSKKEGNCNSQTGPKYTRGLLDWFDDVDRDVDVRLFYTKRKDSDWTKCEWDSPACHTPEAHLFA